MKATVVSYKNKQLADCWSKNEHPFKFAFLSDIFAKMNKFNVSVQDPEKNMYVSDKIAVFIKKAIVIERRYRKRVGTFAVLYVLI